MHNKVCHGFSFIVGLRDSQAGASAKFNFPEGCTPFGNAIAIADYNNHAVRVMDLESLEVTTIIERGTADGVYTGFTSGGGGVSYPLFIESVNKTHLIVAQKTAEIRVIDTVNEVISTLVEVGTRVGLYELILIHGVTQNAIIVLLFVNDVLLHLN